MSEPAWGPASDGVRFGLRIPPVAEAGGSILVGLVCHNVGTTPVRMFGFNPKYPRALRVSPPKAARPYIRVSFGDLNVLHPPDAFSVLQPGDALETALDLSFAFDRRGTGTWQLAFAYDPVRTGAHFDAYQGGDEAPLTAVADLTVSYSRSLREAGIDEATEATLDAALYAGEARLLDLLRHYGEGGVAFAARRVARVLSPGAESVSGWRALDALALLGPEALTAVGVAREEIPHAEPALAFAARWLAFRRGGLPEPHDLPFVTMLERIVQEPGTRGNLQVAWTGVDSAIHGLRRVQVFGNGERIVTSRAPGETFNSTRRTMLRPHEMQALVEAVRASAVWLAAPLREQGLPDEPRPTFEIQLGMGAPFCRQVAMWNGEWRCGPASNLADLMDRLASDHMSESIPPR
ncbi:MAG: hypothetical protein R3B40_18705 [Polyangiales bacterium]